MQITDVRVFPVADEKLKAFVSIVLDRCFMVNDIKVIQGKDGLFISMPSRKKRNGEFKDIAHPLNQETRRELEDRVLAEYRAQLDRRAPATPSDGAEAAPVASWERPTGGERTLEEVERQHLNDSFWGVG